MEIYKGYIYCITNTSNGKRYIGQTIQDIETRFYQHKKECFTRHTKTALYQAFEKYSIENFKIDEVCCITDTSKSSLKSQLNELEIKYISEYNTLSPNGYNMTKGGDTSGFVRAMEIVQVDKLGNVVNCFPSMMDASRSLGVSSGQLSDVISGKYKTANGFYWFLKNDVKIENNVVVNQTLPNKIIAKYSIAGELIDTYLSLKEASELNNVTEDSIGGCCRGWRAFSGGFRWKYYSTTDDILKNIGEYKDPRYKSIKQKDKQGNLIHVYPSIKDASEATGVRSNNICACCKGVYKSSGGFIWEYGEVS